jgi:hypothetical protein
MKTLEEKIKVMQHAADGGEVQVYLFGRWYDILKPEFNWFTNDYRIKPEDPKKYRVVPPKNVRQTVNWGELEHTHFSAAVKQAKAMSKACTGHAVLVRSILLEKEVFQVVVSPVLRMTSVVTNKYGGSMSSSTYL